MNIFVLNSWFLHILILCVIKKKRDISLISHYATPIAIFSYHFMMVSHININKRPAYLPSQSKMLLISYIYNLKVIFQTRWFQWFDFTRNGIWDGMGDALPLLYLLIVCWRCWVRKVIVSASSDWLSCSCSVCLLAWFVLEIIS